MKRKLICALSLNLLLACALNAKSVEDISADRVDIQKIYNIYNNELVAENNSLMKALNSFADNIVGCRNDFYSNDSKAVSLAKNINAYEADLNAFSLSYRDLKANYERQTKALDLLNKVKSIDENRVQHARNLLKNLDLIDPKDLNQVRALENSLSNLEARYTSFNQTLATSSISFSLVKPQIEGIDISMKSLENFFSKASENLEESQKSLEAFEPKVEILYSQYQANLDIAIKIYNNAGVLAEGILAKSLESFYDIKQLKEVANFDSYKNLRLNNLSQPRDMIKASSYAMVSRMEMSETSPRKAKSKYASPASYEDSADGLHSRAMMMASAPNNIAKTIKELRAVNAIIDDLNDNLNTANAVLVNINTLSSTIKTMGDTSINLLKRALNLSTESQVLLTNMEIFKSELNIKTKQAEIILDNIKKSLEEIESSKNKIEELL